MNKTDFVHKEKKCNIRVGSNDDIDNNDSYNDTADDDSNHANRNYHDDKIMTPVNNNNNEIDNNNENTASKMATNQKILNNTKISCMKKIKLLCKCLKYFENLQKFRFIYAENIKKSIINWHKYSNKIIRKGVLQTFQVISKYVYVDVYVNQYIYTYTHSNTYLKICM
jgi:hypothetical protein